jgi:glucosamine-6-phosphate deaminase
MGAGGLRVRIFPTARHAAAALARCVAREVRANPRLVLGLPTGRTPIALYQEIVALERSGHLDLSTATTFNLDEFAGIAAAHPGSYRAFMRRHLFDRLRSPIGRIHFLDGTAPDAARECERYERAIARAGGIDLLILGLGANGHIGFNEPGRRLVARTHLTRLTAATRAANAALFGGRASRVPRQALSMGMATILHARRIVLLATGAGKARTVAAAIRGPLTPRVPASFLQLHRHAEVWLDEAGASRLPGRRAGAKA